MPAIVIPGRTAKTRPSGPWTPNVDSPQYAGLIGWWPGTMASTTIWRGLGTVPSLRSATLVSGSVSGAPDGALAPAYSGSTYGGITDSASTPTETPLDALSALTAVAWGITTSSAVQNYLSVGDNTNWRVRLSSGNLQWIGNGAGNILTGTVTVSTNRLVHLAVASDAAGTRLYVNGQLDNSNATAFSNTGNNGFLAIGNRFEIGGANEPWVGWLTDVRLYNRGLTAPEIWALYAPQSRWDLYWTPGRRVIFDVPAAPAGTAARARYYALLGVA